MQLLCPSPAAGLSRPFPSTRQLIALQLCPHIKLSAGPKSSRRTLAPVRSASHWRRVQASTSLAPAPGDDLFTAEDQRPVILYDGVCNLCNGGVNFILQWDQSSVYRLAALQSDAGKELLKRSGRSPDDLSSIVLVEQDRSYIKSEAILRIAKRLQAPLQLLANTGLLAPRPVRDALYDQVANNRYNIFGKIDSCRLRDENHPQRFLD